MTTTAGERDPALTVYQEEPFNAGTPLAALRRSFITPHPLFYARNHAPIPAVDPAAYRLAVTGAVADELHLSLDDLRAFPAHTLTATLQCAGHRRAELMAVKEIPGQTPWAADAIGTAEWTGVPLHALLEAAGVEGAGETARHVAFTGLDTAQLEGHTFRVGSSIPLEKARRPEVLLAYAMNGAPLPARHGFPLRAVVPGYAGIRSIKWLGRRRHRRLAASLLHREHERQDRADHVRGRATERHGSHAAASGCTVVSAANPAQGRADARRRRSSLMNGRPRPIRARHAIQPTQDARSMSRALVVPQRVPPGAQRARPGPGR